MQRRLQGSSSSCLFHAPAFPSLVSLSSSLIFPSPSAPRSAPILYPIVSIARLLGPAPPGAPAFLSLLLAGEDHVGGNLLILVLDLRFAHVKVRQF
ncbi:hypothetical protein BDW72DRAFT_105915 [Aspergillus terricola var. indicus]